MTKEQFMIMATICALETYFWTEAIKREQFFLAVFFGLLLFRHLQQSYKLSKLTDHFEEPRQKKD